MYSIDSLSFYKHRINKREYVNRQYEIQSFLKLGILQNLHVFKIILNIFQNSLKFT